MDEEELSPEFYEMMSVINQSSMRKFLDDIQTTHHKRSVGIELKFNDKEKK